jgi:GntR family transcriptional regulator
MPLSKRVVPVPLYHQVKVALLREIEGGRWSPGDQLPTENELIEQFHVSKITVRQALADLAQMGYIRREQGRGTFVQRPPLEEGPRELTSFTGEMRGHGMSASSHVLQQEAIPAPLDVADCLQIAEGAPVLLLRRLRLAEGQPMGLQTSFIPLDLAPGIERIAFENASLYEILATTYSLHAASARESHRAVLVGREDGALLRVPAGSPALAAERLTRLGDGRPLEYVQTIMRGDRYKIVLDLSRPGR